jgi:tRNA1(Val) A37 N6-methylase TrmN6
MEPFLLLGWALEAGMPDRVADLGCGSGVMALLLARLGARVSAWDLRPEWIAMARRSARESGLDASFELADLRALPRDELDLAVMNPPYHLPGAGPRSPDPLKAAAHLELNGSLMELVGAGARVARRLCLVVRAWRHDEALRALEAAGLRPTRICRLDDALTLAEGRRRPWSASLVEERVPMRIDGSWSPRVRAWYERIGARLDTAPRVPRP